MAPTEGRVAKLEQQWDCHHGTPKYYTYRNVLLSYNNLTIWRAAQVKDKVLGYNTYKI